MWAELEPYYEKQLEFYEDETDMCNQLGLNYDQIYIYHDDDDYNDDDYDDDDYDDDDYDDDYDDDNIRPSYEEWLEATGAEDSEETRGWYDCPPEESSDYIENHQEWWNNF